MSIKVDFRHHWPSGFALDVQFEVPSAGVTALFGRSGCGKTTVLRCVAGLHRASGHCLIEGEIWQQGRQWLPPHQRPIGYVFQEASLFPHLSVQGNLDYSRHHGNRQRVGSVRQEDIVELLGIGDLLNRRPERLSGGERQRVAIARALLSRPRLLLMDEPLAALDQMAKTAILPYLERLHRELQLPVLYVSHDIREVARLADRMVLLEAGRVRANGLVSDLMTSLDLTLAGADEATSILEGVVSGHDESFHLTAITCGGNRFLVPREALPFGSRARIQIHARDVSLALHSRHDTSILNIFPAQIVETRDADQTQLLVRLRLLDGQILLARITRRSGLALGLREGMLIYAQVKSVALLD
ncbi:molybdenum ABC transporter ATP-binding protein [Ectothiorhodospiraceae bacterium BW-2]|nr:molybdenum ABC transporter ATP-binding protein [Ectothiorhodospiraceae bacterium BW-2]